jgi:hypothetical protein
MAILEGHKQNFETLRRAFCNGRAALLECQLTATGETVAVICAVSDVLDSEDLDIMPFAIMFQDNPYELLNPPNVDGGFHPQKETE